MSTRVPLFSCRVCSAVVDPHRRADFGASWSGTSTCAGVTYARTGAVHGPGARALHYTATGMLDARGGSAARPPPPLAPLRLSRLCARDDRDARAGARACCVLRAIARSVYRVTRVLVTARKPRLAAHMRTRLARQSSTRGGCAPSVLRCYKANTPTRLGLCSATREHSLWVQRQVAEAVVAAVFAAVFVAAQARLTRARLHAEARRHVSKAFVGWPSGR